jgi:serine/threonine-protein kinase
MLLPVTPVASGLLAGACVDGRFRLQALVGQGAMGEVWRVRNEATGREHALKIMLPAVSRDPKLVRRFLAEARTIGRLESQQVVQVFDTGIEGTEPARPYIVMELLRGETLADLLRREGRLPIEVVLSIAEQIARGLAAAHAAGIVHRDLKPANVFLHEAGGGERIVKLLDFGISKLQRVDLSEEALTTTGVILGSPAYMSPEQASGGTVDARTDVWAFGVLMFRALIGELPFRAENFQALLHALTFSKAPSVSAVRPEVPAGLNELVSWCLAKEREVRPHDGGALVAALARIAKGEPMNAPGACAVEGARLGGGALDDHERRGGHGSLEAALASARADVALLDPETETETTLTLATDARTKPGMRGSRVRRWLALVAAIVVGAGLAGLVGVRIGRDSIAATRAAPSAPVAAGDTTETPAVPTPSIAQVAVAPAAPPTVAASATKPPSPTARPTHAPTNASTTTPRKRAGSGGKSSGTWDDPGAW